MGAGEARGAAGRRRRFVLGCVLALAAGGVAAGAVAWWPSQHRSVAPPATTRTKRSAPTTTTRGRPVTPANRTFLGPDGVESTAVIAENDRPGTTAWKISGSQGKGYIEGFASTTYAAAGDRVALYVSTTAASYDVTAYRMGWYHGSGAREIWRSPVLAGAIQPGCPVTPATNMVACDDWKRSLTVPITDAFVPGDYLLKLVGSGNQQSYVLLTVWDLASHATYLMIGRSLTEQGWNTYGGYDFYQGLGPCAPGAGTYPPCNRARVVSFDRPYATGEGASDFLTDEYPLVEFAEEHGLDVTYCTDVTVDEHPAMLLAHRALLSLGHDETWTWPELQGAETALAHGVNIAFLGAAAVVRHARLQPSPLGADREEVDYRDSAEDPLDGVGSPDEVTGNTWASPPTGIDVTALTGELYSGFVEPGEPAAPFVVWDAGAWIFKGTGLHAGSTVPGVISSDIDHLEPGGPMPQDLEVLGHSPVPLSEAYTNQGQWGADTYSDMTYYTDPASKAGVFDSGTVSWVFALTPCTDGGCPAGLVGKITGNLLWLFGQGPAGRLVPSVANWTGVTPPGS
jgi:hypothetical protein